jgi:hypothetical protein
MRRAIGAIFIAALVLLVGLTVSGPWTGPSPASPVVQRPLTPSAEVSFSFGAAADYGFSGDTQTTMTNMGNAGLAFVVSIGDFSYGETDTANWCNFFESKIGDGHSILVTGNHDMGDIDAFRQYCNFGIDAPMTGDYGKEFYFDYPRIGPLIRIIMTSCGSLWDCYDTTNPHYTFISDAIDSARSTGIPWIAVGSHKPCINSGSYACEFGQPTFDLTLSKRVDLILWAHYHSYQRSQQLTCATDNNYRPECVSHADTPYVKGDGAVVNIVGTGGRDLYGIDENSPDRPYFAVARADSKGFMKYSVNATTIRAEFVRTTGSLADSFTIGNGGSPPPPPPSGPTARFTFAPSVPQMNEPITFDASSSTSTPGATLQSRWDWDSDGTWDTPLSSTLTAVHAFGALGTYTVTLEIQDSNALVDTTSHAVPILPLNNGEAGAPPGYGLIDPSRLQARGPIFIGNNAGFTSANGVRRGTGTLADPYVISDWLIDGTSYTAAQAMIHVESTDAYLIIENNKIINLADPNHWEAIQLGHWPATINTLHVAIRHNYIENARHAYGIAVREGSQDIRVEANHIRLDANYDWVYGIATDRGVHDVTIDGNYVDAYTSGMFHTTGIHLSDTHVDDARRATGLVATRNTVVNATGGAIVSASSSGTVIGWNLLYMDYPGTKSVSAGFPRGVDTAWNSNGAVVVGNVIHTFESGILVGSDNGLILSNTIYDVNYGIFVPDNGSMPGVSSYADTIYNTTMWNVAQGSVRLPSDFAGTVVDLGDGIRSNDLTRVLFVIHGSASRVSVSWSGQLLNMSATIGGAAVFDTATTAESQTLEASWTGSIAQLGLIGLSTSRVSFRLESGADVLFAGSGFAPSTSYNLIRSNAGGMTQILSVQSTPSGALLLTIPGSEKSDYAVTTEGVSTPWTTIPVLLQAIPMLLPGMALGLLLVSFLLARRRHRRKRRHIARKRTRSAVEHRDPEGTDDW